MKLQPASKKEVLRIALGSAVCSGILLAGLFIASLVGVGQFSYRSFVGAIGGSAVAVLNFAIMCLTVQSAVNIGEQKQMKAFIQASYNGRLMLQAVWVVLCFAVPHIDLIAGAAPLLFPSVIIFYLQRTGKLVTPSQRKNPPAQEQEEPEEYLGSFEV